METAFLSMIWILAIRAVRTVNLYTAQYHLFAMGDIVMLMYYLMQSYIHHKRDKTDAFLFYSSTLAIILGMCLDISVDITYWATSIMQQEHFEIWKYVVVAGSSIALLFSFMSGFVREKKIKEK